MVTRRRFLRRVVAGLGAGGLMALLRRGASSTAAAAPVIDPAHIDEAYSRETGPGNLVAEAMLAAVRPWQAALAIINAGAVHEAMLAGVIASARLPTTLSFNDTLGIVEISGAQLVELLEHALSQVPEPASRFPQVAGLRLLYNATAAPGVRLRSISIGDELPDPHQRYRVVSSTFLLEGGDGYQTLAAAEQRHTMDLRLADVVAAYLLKNPGHTPTVDGRVASFAF